MKKKLVITCIVINVLIIGKAQDDDNVLGRQASLNPILTTVPFLTIAPDSRAGAMGDAGVATSPDINSQQWNASKYVFMEQKAGVALSYTPWLKNLGVTDLNLLYLAGYYKFDDKQTISGGLRYFNLGTIQYTNSIGEPTTTGRPNEFALDAAYSRLFGENFSGGILFRFIYSDIAANTGGLTGNEYNPGISVASDLSIYYQKPMQISRNDAEMAIGLNISNIGTKMAYSSSDDKEFIPTNMRLGGRFSVNLDEYNSLGITVDLNKLLVPTPPKRSEDDINVIEAGKEDNVGPIQGLIQSFYDAPGGFSEEMKEILISVGGEYWYRNQFAVRAGYFHEAQMKGNRKYFTAGIGLKLNIFSLDFSYLIPSGGRTSPLANTMRFTLGFAFE